jgi:hypothetical protein
MMNATEIARLDLHRTCVHEAAHLSVARRLGYEANRLVWRTEVTDWRARNLYTGRTYFFGNIDDECRRLIGLAGSLAELLDDDRDIEAVEAHDMIFDGISPLSPSDAEGAGDFD